MNQPSLTITIGLPGSGKTTWALQQLAQAAPGTATRLNRDALRAAMLPPGYQHPPVGSTDNPAEDMVTVAQHAAIRALLASGVSVICDDTNLREQHVAALTEIADGVGAEVTVVDFTGVPVETCIERDSRREGTSRVGEDAIRAMADQWTAAKEPAV